MDFPIKPQKSLSLDELKAYLLTIQGNGLNIYGVDGRPDQFEIELSTTKTIRCIHLENKCQVQLLAYSGPLSIADVEDQLQLKEAVESMIIMVLGSFPSAPLSARLIQTNPASNYKSISNLINGSEITAVFDPYLDNSSLETLINICSFGSSGFSNNTRLLSSSKKTSGKNPTFTKAGVDAFLNQKNISGEGRILASNSEHRRFILLSGGRSLLLGHSLNSIHKNEAIRIEPDTEDLAFFNLNWSTASPLT